MTDVAAVDVVFKMQWLECWVGHRRGICQSLSSVRYPAIRVTQSERSQSLATTPIALVSGSADLHERNGDVPLEARFVTTP
jgi:hypothetical protein